MIDQRLTDRDFTVMAVTFGFPGSDHMRGFAEKQQLKAEQRHREKCLA